MCVCDPETYIYFRYQIDLSFCHEQNSLKKKNHPAPMPEYPFLSLRRHQQVNQSLTLANFLHFEEQVGTCLAEMKGTVLACSHTFLLCRMLAPFRGWSWKLSLADSKGRLCPANQKGFHIDIVTLNFSKGTGFT